MSFLDALTILGAGVGRGYRGSQELQRQIGEAKRKALMDEREMVIREQAQASQDALARAQASNLGSETSTRDFALGESRAESERNATPVMSSGAPTLNTGGNRITLPNRLDIFRDPQIAGSLRQSSEEQFKASHPEYFTNYPPAGTAAAQIRNSPESVIRDAFHEIMNFDPSPTQFEDPEEYRVRVNKMRRDKVKFLDELYPGALDILFKKENPDSTKTKPPKKSETNRFKVTVK